MLEYSLIRFLLYLGGGAEVFQVWVLLVDQKMTLSIHQDKNHLERGIAVRGMERQERLILILMQKSMKD